MNLLIIIISVKLSENRLGIRNGFDFKGVESELVDNVIENENVILSGYSVEEYSLRFVKPELYELGRVD